MYKRQVADAEAIADDASVMSASSASSSRWAQTPAKAARLAVLESRRARRTSSAAAPPPPRPPSSAAAATPRAAPPARPPLSAAAATAQPAAAAAGDGGRTAAASTRELGDDEVARRVEAYAERASERALGRQPYVAPSTPSVHPAVGARITRTRSPEEQGAVSGSARAPTPMTSRAGTASSGPPTLLMARSRMLAARASVASHRNLV